MKRFRDMSASDEEDYDEEQEEEEEEEEEVTTKKSRKTQVTGKRHQKQQQEVKEASMLMKAAELRAQGLFTDLTFITKDGRQLPVHRVVLASVLPPTSQLYGFAMQARLTQSETDGSIGVACSWRMMEALLDFIYEGRLVMSTSATSSSASTVATAGQVAVMDMESSSSSSSSSAVRTDAATRRARIAIHPDEVWELVHYAELYGVPGVAERVREEIQRELLEEVRVEKAVAYLYDLHQHERHHAEARALLAFVIDLIVHNFEHFAPMFYFNVLPYPLFHRIIHHPELSVKREVVVWDAVRKYCATVQPAPSPAETANLVSAVRFGYMTAEELRGAESSGLVSDDLIKEGFFHSLQRKESRAKWHRHIKHIMQQPFALLPLSSIRSLPRPKPGKLSRTAVAATLVNSATCDVFKVFRYKKTEFGKDGIVWWLGTDRGKSSTYTNPVDSKVIGVTPSSHHSGYPLNAVLNGYPSAGGQGSPFGSRSDFFTNSTAGSWLIFDFGAKYRRLRIKPTHITIRPPTGGAWALCNFNFEGSNSQSKWKTLLTVSNDMAMGSGAAKTWPLKKNKKVEYEEDEEDEEEEEEEEVDNQSGYRYFRILCTGPDTSSSQYLALSGFEIYGTVMFVDK